VGGTCAEATVRDQSLALLASGEAMVVRITPVAEPDQPGKLVVHNPCLSGGTLAVFLVFAIEYSVGLPFGPDPGVAEALGPLVVGSKVAELGLLLALMGSTILDTRRSKAIAVR